MTKLEKWKRLASDATPGPWDGSYHNRTETWTVTWRKPGLDEHGEKYDPVNQCENVIVSSQSGHSKDSLDTEFIAASREAVPVLIECLEMAMKAIEDIHFFAVLKEGPIPNKDIAEQFINNVLQRIEKMSFEESLKQIREKLEEK